MNPEINHKKKFVPLDHEYLSIQSKKQEEIMKLMQEEQRLQNNMDVIDIAQEKMMMEEETELERQRMLENTRTPDFAALQEIVWSDEDSGSEGRETSMFNIGAFGDEEDRIDERSYDTGQRQTLKMYSDKERIKKIMQNNYFMTAYDRMLLGKDLQHQRIDHRGKERAKQLKYGRVGTLKPRKSTSARRKSVSKSAQKTQNTTRKQSQDSNSMFLDHQPLFTFNGTTPNSSLKDTGKFTIKSARSRKKRATKKSQPQRKNTKSRSKSRKRQMLQTIN